MFWLLVEGIFKKLKAGIFDEPQICKLIQDQAFTSHMTALESAAWCSYVSGVREFLNNMQLTTFCGSDSDEGLKTGFGLKTGHGLNTIFLRSRSWPRRSWS